MASPPDAAIPRLIPPLLRGEPENFDPGNYIRRFAGSPYAYLEGFKEFCGACVLEGGFKDPDHAVAMVRAATAEAVDAARDEWKAQFPKGQWEALDPNQVTQANDYSPMCLEKALLVILATRIACQRPVFGALHRLDPFKFITIHPAIYRLTGQETCGTLLKKLKGRMKRSEHAFVTATKIKLQKAAPRDAIHATEARAGGLLLQALEGRSMTWKNADFLSNAFNEAAFNSSLPATDVPFDDCMKERMGVRVLKGRNDDGLFSGDKRCNTDEGPFVTPTKADQDAMRAAVKKGADAFRRARR
jgi:hypothetical protein